MEHLPGVVQEPRCGAHSKGVKVQEPGCGARVRGVQGAVQRLLLLLFDAFTNELSDLFIREIKDGIAISGFRLSVRSLRNQ